MTNNEIISQLNELQAGLNVIDFYLEDKKNTPYYIVSPNKKRKKIVYRIEELEKEMNILV